MNNRLTVAFLCILYYSTVSAQQPVFGHGSHRPLNDADGIAAIKPVCDSDRYGNKYLPCATPDINDPRNWPCIKLSDLCNSKRDCPNGDDENEFQCFYHKFRTEEYRKLFKALEELKGR